jgi:hypothetical protein
LTLETAGAFFAAAFRATGLVAAFFAFTADLGFAADFLAARRLTAVRADGFAAAALLALGLDGDFAFAARFALFAAGLAFERDVDRLNPFVRLLLMCGISKGCSPVSSRRNVRSLPHMRLYINGDKYLRVLYLPKIWSSFREMCQQRKTLDGHCWPMLKCFRLTGGLIHLGKPPQPKINLF